MNAGEAFAQTYLNDVLKILESASKQSLQRISEDQDADLAAYIISLRETIVECYTTIIHGITTQQTKSYLV